MKNEIITLITPETVMEEGFRRETARNALEVMADVRDTKYSEFFQAAHAGISVQLTAAVNREDYDAAVIVRNGRKLRPVLAEYDGTEYRIIRIYRRKRTMELTLQEVE